MVNNIKIQLFSHYSNAEYNVCLLFFQGNVCFRFIFQLPIQHPIRGNHFRLDSLFSII